MCCLRVIILAAKPARHKTDQVNFRDLRVVGLLFEQSVDGQIAGDTALGFGHRLAEHLLARWKTLSELICWSLETDIEVDFASPMHPSSCPQPSIT